MSLLITCPEAAAVGTVLLDDCPQDVGQVQKLFFQRIYSTGTTRNTMTAVDAKLLATWTPLFAAIDGTKVQQSPFIAAPENELGAPVTYGGGNDTPNGELITVAFESSKFTCKILRVPAKTAESLKLLVGEKLGVYMVNEHGRIWSDSDDATTPVNLYPVQISDLNVSDRKLGGRVEPDSYMITFNLPPNWSDKFVETIPTDFDPLTDFANA